MRRVVDNQATPGVTEFAGVELVELSDLIGLCNQWVRRLISVVHLRILAFALTIPQE